MLEWKLLGMELKISSFVASFVHKRFHRMMLILFPNVVLDFVIKSVAKRKEKPNATKLIKSLTNTASSCGHFFIGAIAHTFICFN